MSVPVFQKIIEQVSPLTRLVTLHLMGEPLLHPHLSEFVEICHQAKVKIFLVSNGVLLREKEMQTLLHPAFHQINFSIHSFANNFVAKDITPYLERIFLFTEQAFRERPDLYINYRLWNLNDPQGSTTDNREILQHIEDRFQKKVNVSLNVKERKSIHLKQRLFLHFDTEFTWPSLDRPLLGTRGTCYGLSSHFGILVDGTVVPCCLDKEGKIPLGNILEMPIADILGSPRAQTILQGFRSRRLVEELCKRCQFIERFA